MTRISPVAFYDIEFRGLTDKQLIAEQSKLTSIIIPWITGVEVHNMAV